MVSILQKRVRAVAVGVGVMLAASTGVAYAATAPTNGGYAQNVGNVLSVYDTANDNNAIYTNWNNSTNNRMETKNAQGSKKEATISGLQNFRACRDRGTAFPDTCSGYVGKD